MATEDRPENEIDELKARLRDLQDRYDFLMAALENLPNPIFLKDEGARFLFFNRRYSEVFGMNREDYLGKSVLDLDYLPEEDRSKYQKEDLGLIENGHVISYEKDFDFSDGNRHPSLYWSKGVHDPVSGKKGLIGEIVDISKERHLRESLDRTVEKLRRTNRKLEKLAEIDVGTGIYNRTQLNKQELEMANRHSGVQNCALMADLDHFKRVNDLYGHIKGDEILARFATILKDECRENDVPIRYGGEEFLLFLNNANLTTGEMVAERIRRRCEEEIMLPNGDAITVSIGVAMMDDNLNLQGNIAKLDHNLYIAKNSGRNCVISESDTAIETDDILE